MASSQTLAQQQEKSEGKTAYGDALDRITTAHASMRLVSGFDFEHAIAEYRALRARILRPWAQTKPSNQEQNLDEVIRFNETIDQAIAEVTRSFAHRATRYGDRFVGILAHDVRSPLQLINLAAEHLLVDGSLKDPQVNDVSRIFRGVRRIERLVNDLAVLVRNRASQPVPLTKTNLDLGVICEEALEEVKASHVDVVFELQRLGDLSGDWDRERLAQVVSNLAVNAVVHASAKRVELTLEDAGRLWSSRLPTWEHRFLMICWSRFSIRWCVTISTPRANYRADSAWDSSSCAKSRKRTAGRLRSGLPPRRALPFLCVCRDPDPGAGRRRIPSSVKLKNSTPARNAGSQNFALGSVIASVNGEIARGLNDRAMVLISRESDGEPTFPHNARRLRRIRPGAGHPAVHRPANRRPS
jgi:phospho-acceptor domain-containing protein